MSSALAQTETAQTSPDLCRVHTANRKTPYELDRWMRWRPASNSIASTARNPNQLKATMIYAWDRFGYNAATQILKTEADRKRWATCFKKSFDAIDAKTSACGLKIDKSIAKSIEKAKPLKSPLSAKPPQAALDFAATWLGLCFDERNAQVDGSQYGLSYGDFSVEMCEVALQKYDAEKEAGKVVVKAGGHTIWPWHHGYAYFDKRLKRACKSLPTAWLEEFRSDPAYQDRFASMKDESDRLAAYHTPRGNPLAHDDSRVPLPFRPDRADRAMACPPSAPNGHR